MIREKIILNEMVGKDVLDIGSVGQTSSYSLWKLYQEVNYKSLTGIDLEVAEQESYDKFNYQAPNRDEKIVAGNMETHQFDKQFDVVIAGDVIEHVDNQGLFLRNIHKHLKDDGKLIISTPNAKWPTVFIEPNPTHTLWHDKYTLERILSQCGFKITLFKYYYGNKKSYPLLFKPLLYRQGILVICQKNN